MKVAIIDALFDGQQHPLADAVTAWVASSRRFAAFATDNATKIRKKLRLARDAESARDLELELETAYLLLREKAVSVTYEPQPLGTKRGPDFAVAHDAGTTVMFEVTRMRARAGESSGSPGTTAGGEPFGPLEGRRFVDTVCGKMGQLQPQRPNLLLVGTATQLPAASDLEAAMARIRRLAEACDPTVVQRHGFRGRGDFFRHFGRLSAVVVRTLPLVEGAAPVLWLNPLAKQALPRKVRAAIDRSHSR